MVAAAEAAARAEAARARVAAARAKALVPSQEGMAARKAAMVVAADRMTDAPPPGTCSVRSAGGGGWDAARVQATMLRRKMQE